MNNWLDIIAETCQVLGEVLIAFAAIRVSYRFRHEHKVDAKVFAEMKVEHDVAILGVILLLTGYVMRLSGYL